MQVLWMRRVEGSCSHPSIQQRQQQPGCRLRCFCTATDSETEVIGTLGGRDIVTAGSVNPQDYFVKTISKGEASWLPVILVVLWLRSETHSRTPQSFPQTGKSMLAQSRAIM